MLDIFRGLKSLIKISHVHIDTAVFRLHYSLTVILLISFSLIVTTRQYVGNPIDCIHSKDLPEDVLNTYCWIHSTYTITAAYRKREGFEVPFLGVDNSKSHPETERKEYRYYQWVCFMLFLQVIDRRSFPFLSLFFFSFRVSILCARARVRVRVPTFVHLLFSFTPPFLTLSRGTRAHTRAHAHRQVRNFALYLVRQILE